MPILASASKSWRAKAFTNNLRFNRWINVAWLMVAWVVLQVMMGWLAGGQGYLLARPLHPGDAQNLLLTPSVALV